MHLGISYSQSLISSDSSDLNAMINRCDFFHDLKKKKKKKKNGIDIEISQEKYSAINKDEVVGTAMTKTNGR